MEKWIDDLQSKMSVNCGYCGRKYGPISETSISMADILKNHIEECDEHPMSKLKKKYEELKKKYKELKKE